MKMLESDANLPLKFTNSTESHLGNKNMEDLLLNDCNASILNK